jgi:hypothetical protein
VPLFKKWHEPTKRRLLDTMTHWDSSRGPSAFHPALPGVHHPQTRPKLHVVCQPHDGRSCRFVANRRRLCTRNVSLWNISECITGHVLRSMKPWSWSWLMSTSNHLTHSYQTQEPIHTTLVPNCPLVGERCHRPRQSGPRKRALRAAVSTITPPSPPSCLAMVRIWTL